MRSLKPKTFCVLVLFVYAAFTVSGIAQAVPRREGPRASAPPATSAPRDANGSDQEPEFNGETDTSERSLAVDPRVNVSLCIEQGNVRVNGWSRNEVRVFVSDGSKFGFKVLQKSSAGKPVWIMLVGMETRGGVPAIVNQCIWGAEIEIDAPEGAVINLKGRESRARIDSIRKVSVSLAGGDIAVRNISEGVVATTYRGGVTVENAKGSVTLETNEGNIVAFGSSPSEIGDTFRAKTRSGTISLQRLDHRQVEVNSISGSISYAGEILGGGTYTFTTMNGSIRLAIPVNTSGTVGAVFGYGNFNSEIPMKLLTEDKGPGPVRRISGRLGSGGDATLKLTSDSGSILIKKQ
jgi:hypothetical protein